MTGSGKTVFALWCLSRRSYHRMPWIIVDAKRDPTIKDLPRVRQIGVGDSLPKRPGLYVVRPETYHFADGTMTQWLWRVHKHEHTGLFIDEGYAFSRFDLALQAILTQGRSKKIPVIALAQRPAYISPFITSESEFKSVFFLQNRADIDRVKELMPGWLMDPQSLPPHHSYWYCALTREFDTFGPCPDEAAIMQRFDDRVSRRVYI